MAIEIMKVTRQLGKGVTTTQFEIDHTSPYGTLGRLVLSAESLKELKEEINSYVIEE